MVHFVEICTGAERDLHGTTLKCGVEHLPGNIFSFYRIIFGAIIIVVEYLPLEHGDRKNKCS